MPTIRILSGPGSEDPAALVAAGIPAEPPREWFDFREFPDGTPLTFTTDGQVYGRLANRNVSHVGMPGRRRRAPYSSTGYAYYHVGTVRCADGSMVNTGTITMGGGHASTDPSVTADAARDHYDNAERGIADVVAFDRPDGVYCAGAARPGLTAEQIRMAMASPPSGDWRPIDEDGVMLREPEMIAAHLVVTPGFPSRRNDMALAASANEQDDLCFVASADLSPQIVIHTNTPDAPTEDPMSETTDTTETPEAVAAAAAAPAFGKDDVVRIPEGATLGMVASVDDGRAIVQVEVPVGDLQDAGQEGRLALSASARERLLDSQLAKALTRIEEMEGRMTSLVASAEEKQRGAQALNVLGGIPE